MAPAVLYIVCLIGALGLYLVVRPGGDAPWAARRARGLGAVLGLGAFAYLLLMAGEAVAGGKDGGDSRPELFFTLFSLISIVCAVKMIAHSRPVYSALYFVLVVLASAGLFLLLEAEFMAFALIIVYAGAILITYMFVLMLAQQAPDSNDPGGQPEYDLNPREPAAGAIVGFVLLAVLSRMALEGATGLAPPPSPAEVRTNAWRELQLMPGRIEEFVGAEIGGVAVLAQDDGVPRLTVEADGTAVAYHETTDGETQAVELPPEAMPENVQSVGLALIAKFPVSLELAGVILLMAMFGAVILARRQIELTEDEKREAAGLRRLGHHDDEDGGAADEAAPGAPPAGEGP